MKVKLLQAACIGGKDYAKGVHDIPDAVLKKDEFFLSMVKAKLACDPEAEVLKPESLEQRNQRLAHKLLNDKENVVAKTGAVPKTDAEKAEDEEFDDEVAGFTDEELEDEEVEETEEESFDDEELADEESEVDDDSQVDEEVESEEESEPKAKAKPKKKASKKKTKSKSRR